VFPRRDWVAMTWQDLAAAETSRWIAVLPIAAVEQHGPHLPLGVDAFIGEAYLARTREGLPAELPVTFLPMLSIGASDEHRSFPGTLTISPPTTIGLLTEIGESVFRAGLRKLVIINSHGGNVPAIAIAARALRVRLGMLVITGSWARFGYPPGLFTAEELAHGVHAGDIETSIMLAHQPERVRREHVGNFPSAGLGMEQEFTWLRPERPSGFGWVVQDLHPAGAVGDASVASAQKGVAALAHGAQAFIELLCEVDRFDLTRLKRGPLS
jgi:creatinine amidohydrolase